MRILLSILFTFIVSVNQAQSDSLSKNDSFRQRINSFDRIVPAQPDTTGLILIKKPILIRFDTVLLDHHPYYHFSDPLLIVSKKRIAERKDVFFYTTLGLLFFFAIIRQGFSKYLKDLFRIFFRTTMKQRQVKDQLMQKPLPSLLLNILFVLTGAFFINRVFSRHGIGQQYNFWWLYFYSLIGIATIYLVKFLTLKFCAWLFALKEPINDYIFIVFTTNKILGVVFLPLIILLTFTSGIWNQVFYSAGLVLIGGIFLYRFYLTFATIHRQVKVSFLHFLIYIISFEVAPLLLINKLLFKIIE